MPEKNQNQKIILQPSWKQFFVSYLVSILAIPVFGIGFIALYFVWKKHHSFSYEVTNIQISSVDSKYHRTIDLVNIERVDLQQSWLQEKLEIGTLVLHTSASQMHLVGMTSPARLQQTLETAIQAEKERHKQQNKPKPREPEYEPGSMERMDYLTGLWQQGLISNEEYEKERKHFE